MTTLPAPTDQPDRDTCHLPATTGQVAQAAADAQSAIELLRAAVVHLADLAAANPDDIHGQAAAYGFVDTLRADLSAVADDIAHRIIPAVPHRGFLPIDGVGVFEAPSSSLGTTWDQDAVWQRTRQLAREAAMRTANDDGEVDMASAVEAALATVRALQSPPAWRKTALEQHGLAKDDIKDLCETRYGPRRLKFTPSRKEASR